MAVMADFDPNKVFTPECMAWCPNLGPQGMAVQLGAYHRTEALTPHTEVDLWPSFCGMASIWTTKKAAFTSEAIIKGVVVTARLPAMFAENWLPRPANKLP